MVQDEWGRFFPFQNVRIFENRSTKNIFASIWKIFPKKGILTLIFFSEKILFQWKSKAKSMVWIQHPKNRLRFGNIFEIDAKIFFVDRFSKIRMFWEGKTRPHSSCTINWHVLLMETPGTSPVGGAHRGTFCRRHIWQIRPRSVRLATYACSPEYAGSEPACDAAAVCRCQLQLWL